MATAEYDLLCAFETHHVRRIRAVLDAGLDIRAPISYARLGLLPQVQRREADIYANIRCLLRAAGRSVPPLDNVPNRYLSQ